MFGWITLASQWSIPLILMLILAAAHKNKVRIYEVFVQGALEGLRTTFKLAPYILAIFVAIGLFRSSGALNLCIETAKPLLSLMHIPPDLLTLALMKPLSGSASLGITADLLQKYGPDSLMGLTASLAQGCSETTFYVLSLYLGSVNIKEGRHTVLMGLTSELAAFLMAIGLGSLLFG
ncbi:MAG TPA: nucleoside recognition domain-containing protein [Bacillota bacterium]|nr:nucleoside recognition domain-containing protein [Bacillota bacterium]